MEVVGSSCVFLVMVTGQMNLIAFVAPVVLSVTALGFVAPNVTALALSLHPELAGSAAALMGVAQVSLPASLAPLAGIAGPQSGLPLSILMMVGAATATAAFLTVARMGPPKQPSEVRSTPPAGISV
jgi:DHA1 family bicyclomycin/chloramphenicol resistance-like MFS transporter